MKASELFIETIKNHLLEASKKDLKLKEAMTSDQKNIEDCIQYILNNVFKSGINGFHDQEIFDMATEYYLTENAPINSRINISQVVVNRVPELTELEKHNAKQKAFETLVQEEKNKISKKQKTKKTESTTPTLF